MSALIRYKEPAYTLSNIFDEFLSDGFFCNTSSDVSRTSWPKVDIVEQENDYSIHADLPGLEHKDIKVVVEDGVLAISGEKTQEKKEKEKGRYHYYERSYGKFSRSFQLPENVDEKNIDASFKNGVLKLTIKKTEKAKPQSIEVKIN